MKVDDAITLIEIGTTLVTELVPSIAPEGAIVEQLAELIQKQVQLYQQLSGKPMSEVLELLTPVFIDQPEATE